MCCIDVFNIFVIYHNKWQNVSMLEKYLQEIGLNEKEATVHLVLVV